MATNRYTNITPSQFNPLSLQEIMMAPLGRQKQHEEQAQQLSEAGIFDVDRLESDDPYIKGQISDFRERTAGIEDELLQSGTSSSLAKKLMNIKRERETFLSNDGAGGRAQNAYDAYGANVKALNSNKNLSQRQRDLGLQYALKQYGESGGAEGSGRYGAYQGADNVNIEELAAKRAGEMSAQEISEITGWTENDNGTWTNGTTTTEKLPRQVIANAVMNSLSNDLGVQNFMQDAQQIGMIEDPTAMLQNAALNSADRFQVNNWADKEDMKFTPGYGQVTESGSDNGMNWNLLSSPGDIREKPSESTMSMIGRGAQHPGITFMSMPQLKTVDGYTNPNYREEMERYNKEKAKGGKRYSVDDLAPEEKTRYDLIAKELKNKGRIRSTDLNDPEVIQALNDYDTKYGNYTYNVKVISDTSGGVGNYSSGMVAKDSAAVLRQAQSDKFNQLYMHPDTGKAYTWEQMQNEFNVVDVDLVQGYADVDNNLATNLDNQKEFSDRKGEFASPMSVTLVDTDGKQLPNFYMTRNRGQMNRPRYQADIKLNEFFNASRSLPEVRTELILGDKEFESSYLPEATVMEILSQMSNDVLGPDGIPREDADPVQYSMYVQLNQAMQEAGPRNGVYMLGLPGDESGMVNYKTKQQIQAQMYKSQGLSDFQ